MVSERKIGKISVNEKVQFISCNFSAVNADFPNGNLLAHFRIQIILDVLSGIGCEKLGRKNEGEKEKYK